TDPMGTNGCSPTSHATSSSTKVSVNVHNNNLPSVNNTVGMLLTSSTPSLARPSPSTSICINASSSVTMSQASSSSTVSVNVHNNNLPSVNDNTVGMLHTNVSPSHSPLILRPVPSTPLHLHDLCGSPT